MWILEEKPYAQGEWQFLAEARATVEEVLLAHLEHWEVIGLDDGIVFSCEKWVRYHGPEFTWSWRRIREIP